MSLASRSDSGRPGRSLTSRLYSGGPGRPHHRRRSGNMVTECPRGPRDRRRAPARTSTPGCHCAVACAVDCDRAVSGAVEHSGQGGGGDQPAPLRALRQDAET